MPNNHEEHADALVDALYALSDGSGRKCWGPQAVIQACPDVIAKVVLQEAVYAIERIINPELLGNYEVAMQALNTLAPAFLQVIMLNPED